MKNISFDLSGRIDPGINLCLTVINGVAGRLAIDFFVIGATVRDIILGELYNIPVGRKTQDVDFGVMVDTWDAYQDLKDKLIATGRFEPENKVTHRLIFQKNFPVDIIPFGAVESSEGSIVWPPDNAIKMNVIGFRDAWEHALLIRIDTEYDIRFVSLPGLAVLKIIAWNDRHNIHPTRDAEDFALLLQYYAHAGNEERLYESDSDVMEAVDFDMDLAGARLLGRDMAAIMSQKTRKAVLDILATRCVPDSNDSLVVAITGQIPGKDYERALILLQNLKQGIGKEGKY